MTSTLDRSPDGTFTITLTFPWVEITTAYDHIVNLAVKSTQLPGFRQGKAPRNLVESKLHRTDTLSQALQHLLPDSYKNALTTHQLKPILPPQLRITQASEGQAWVVTATSCETPSLTLPDYIHQLPKQHITNDDHKLHHILDYLTKSTTINLPQLLVSEETNHRLSNLADNLTNLGMTTQSYLASKKITLDELKKQFSDQAASDLTLEFILASIQAQRSLPNRQQTLDFLTTLV